MKRLMRRTAGAAVLAMTVLAETPATAQPEYWHMGGGWGWGHMVFGSLMMLLFWGSVILLIVLAVRWLGGSAASPGAGASQDSALDVLRQRYARGEIDKAEFDERRHTLGSG